MAKEIFKKKIAVDTSDLDKAIDKTDKLTEAEKKSADKSKRIYKKKHADLTDAQRKFLATQLSNLRKQTNAEIAIIKKQAEQRVLTERQAASKIADIRAKAAGKGAAVRQAVPQIKGGAAEGAGLAAAGKAGLAGLAVVGVKKLIGVLGDSIDAFKRAQSAAKGLAAVVQFKLGKEAVPEAQRALDELSQSGILNRSDAAAAIKNLVSMGFSIEQATKLIKANTDVAIDNRQATYSVSEAVRVWSEGMKNQNSVLSDATGVSDNLSTQLKRGGFTMEDLTDKVKGAEARQFLFNEQLRLTAAFSGRAEEAANDYAGASSKLSTKVEELMGAVGLFVTTALTPLLDVLSKGVGWLTDFVKKLAVSFRLIRTEEQKQIDRLEELADKTNKTAQEQTNLANLQHKLAVKYKSYLEVLGLEADQLTKNIDLLNSIAIARQKAAEAVKGGSPEGFKNAGEQIQKLGIYIKTLQERIQRNDYSFFSSESLEQDQKNLQLAQIQLKALQEAVNDANDKQVQKEEEKNKKTIQLNKALYKKLLALREQYDSQLTDTEQIEDQIGIIEEQLAITQDGLEREALLKEQARLNDILDAQEYFTTIGGLERDLLDKEFELAQLRAKRQNLQRQQELKAEIQHTKTLLKVEQEKVKQKLKLDAEEAKRRRNIAQTTFDVFQFLLEADLAGFKKYLANRIREFTRAKAEEAYIEGLARLAAQDYSGAAFAFAQGAAIQAAGHFTAQAIESTIETPEAPTAGDDTPDIGTIGADNALSSQLDTGTNAQIIDNSTTVEIIQTGTYLDSAQAVREAILPTIDELNIERGAVVGI